MYRFIAVSKSQHGWFFLLGPSLLTEESIAQIRRVTTQTLDSPLTFSCSSTLAISLQTQDHYRRRRKEVFQTIQMLDILKPVFKGSDRRDPLLRYAPLR